MLELALIVGLMEVSPGICQVDILQPDQVIASHLVECEEVVSPEVWTEL